MNHLITDNENLISAKYQQTLEKFRDLWMPFYDLAKFVSPDLSCLQILFVFISKLNVVAILKFVTEVKYPGALLILSSLSVV
jgi:hypothetical protein